MLKIYSTKAADITHVFLANTKRSAGWRLDQRWRVAIGCGALLSLAGASRVSEPRRLPVGSRQAPAVALARLIEIHAQGVDALSDALSTVIWDGGLLTDELRSPLNGLPAMPPDAHPLRFFTKNLWNRVSHMDERLLPEYQTHVVDTLALGPLDLRPDRTGFWQQKFAAQLSDSYTGLQTARTELQMGMRQLAGADTVAADRKVVNVLRGELYVLEGYTDILLADLFCSGVPLNTVSPTGVQFQPSSTTTQVYQAALARFDTALALAGDSARILNLARVGKGRAWLALGQYDSAAAAVAAVPQGFSYPLQFARNLDDDGEEVVATVSDREGRNGLPYISSADPRTATDWITTDKVIGRVRMPVKYLKREGMMLEPDTTSGWTAPTNYSASVALGSWEEAVLIQAEAALHKHAARPTWLRFLNQLRATAPIPGTDKADPHRLPPLTDPGTPHGRVALLFAERAYWLFLTGHRQGDLRRLVREYRWPQEQVYPTGPYIVPKDFVSTLGKYGTDVTLPIPAEERANPSFHGCLDRGA